MIVLAAMLCCLLCLLALTGSGNALAGPPGPPDQEADGVAVLRRAVRAGQDVAYEGVQLISARHGSGSDSGLIDVVNRPGEGVSFSTPDAAPVLKAAPSPLDADGKLLDLLRTNYEVVRAGTGTVCERRATIVEARRGDGTVAGRFWVDEATGLLLRRETFDSDGQVAQVSTFVSIDFDPPARTLTTEDGAEPWGDVITSEERADLRGDGWRLPDRLTDTVVLVEARTTGRGADRVVHLCYSEGISVISVFVQRGRLAADPGPEDAAGLRPEQRDGRTVYVSESGQERRLWEDDGFVYTIMADAPPEQVDVAVDALASPDGAEILTQVGRGFGRLGGWLWTMAP
ncbi:sigma-E factor regulatory protein RseB domain-containing protein [Marinactinospora rubrisoli]|uniref:Sigma-E factor regulatory protein RseB domain-containing protein n=1 Tax=Marinactinospora rubrisoli TaxID=2715399 RepID=A0ABW2KEI1_9ACTN